MIVTEVSSGQGLKLFRPVEDETPLNGEYFCRVAEVKGVKVEELVCRVRNCMFRPRGNEVQSRVSIGEEYCGGRRVIIDCRQD